jgi:hypothetical protein
LLVAGKRATLGTEGGERGDPVISIQGGERTMPENVYRTKRSDYEGMSDGALIEFFRESQGRVFAGGTRKIDGLEAAMAEEVLRDRGYDIGVLVLSLVERVEVARVRFENSDGRVSDAYYAELASAAQEMTRASGAR